MEKTIYILGVGRNSIVTIDLAEACGYTIGGLYHYTEGRTGEVYFGHRILGTTDELFASGDLSGKAFALSMGDNDIRADLFRRLTERGALLPALIHPSAVFSKYATCGPGVQVFANSVVDPNVVIGPDTILSVKCTVLHNCRLGAHCFVAIDAVVGADTTLDDYAFVGLNATVISVKANRIGSHAVVGAAAVVTRPVEAGDTVMGMPARTVQKKPTH